MTKLIRITTVPMSLSKLLRGQMRFMSKHFEVIGVSSKGNDLQKVSEYEGIRVKALEMSREITPLKDFRSLMQMIRFLRKEKPQIVHSHTPKAGIVGMLAARIAEVPVRLHTVAGLPLVEATGLKRKVLNVVEKITYACATKVYPNSYGLKQIILDNKFCSEKKLKVIGNGSSNGIDTTYFNPALYRVEDKTRLRKKLDIGDDDFVFIFIGRMVGDKGVNELVEAFSRLNLEIRKQKFEPETRYSEIETRNSKLLLVGPFEDNLDPLLPETKKEIEENSDIIHVGYQAEVRPYLSIADALVFPSYREGFPNVVMQAGAMGLPSIVTDINGCNEIIIEGQNGVIIPPKDAEALYQAMQFFVEKPAEVFIMANNSRDLICKRYEQQLVWDALLVEYKYLEGQLIK